MSYNRTDRESIRIVHAELRARGVSTFLDSENLGVGLPWFPALSRALQDAQAVAVFIGKHGLGVWQMREVWFSLERQVQEETSGRRFPVIPVLLPEADAKDVGFLLGNKWIDLRAGLDDVAALDLLAQSISGTGSAAHAHVPAQAPPIALPPYRGLRSFREVDATLFFGREGFAAQLKNKLSEHRLVAIVGSSGSGKSSVVQAGLLPMLRRECAPHTWEIVTFHPGDSPLHNMALAFIPFWEQAEPDKTTRILNAGQMAEKWARGESVAPMIHLILKESAADRLLIVVDQFEELFGDRAATQRPGFIESLIGAIHSAPVSVLFTLRADYYSQAIEADRELSDLLQAGIVNLGPMKREELRRAMEKPAESVGLRFQEGLVERMLDHVEAQPGHLPLLEFTLAELWETRHDHRITNEQYDSIGGVEGALSKRADTLIRSLPAGRQDEALRLFTRLVRVTDVARDTADSRNRAPLSDLSEAELEVVKSFADARLLVTSRDELSGEETVELAHEALIYAWPRLKTAIDADRGFLLWRQRLNVMIEEWTDAGFHRGQLLREVALAKALRFSEARPGQLNDRESEFIDISKRAATRRRRGTWAIPAILALVLLGVSLSMVWKRSDLYQVRTALSRGTQLATASRNGTEDEWLSALVYDGRSDEAVEIAEDRIQALAVIAEALMKTGQADQARNAADRAYKKANETWDESRHAWKDSEARYDDFIAVATAYAAVGDLQAAQRAMNEALAGRKVEQLGAEALDDLAGLAVRIGNDDRLLDLVNNVDRESFRAFVVRKIGQELARNGDLHRALGVVRNAKSSIVSPYDLESITSALRKEDWTNEARRLVATELAAVLRGEDGKSEDLDVRIAAKVNAALVMTRLGRKQEAIELAQEALKIAPQMDRAKWKLRSTAYYHIVQAFLELGELDDAMVVYREITAQPVQMISASHLALKLVQAGRSQEALSVASKVSAGSFPYADSAFAAIAIELARIGKPEEALAVVNNIGKGQSTAESDRADAFLGIAKALANRRQYRAAIEILDQQKLSRGELTVYSAILREHAKEGNPALAKALGNEGLDDPIFPWLDESD